MSARYVILRGPIRWPRADSDEDEPILTGQTVYEAENTVEDTGLLDASGERIGRCSAKAGVGFLLGKVR